jgi:S-formylglutathione hydrolase
MSQTVSADDGQSRQRASKHEATGTDTEMTFPTSVPPHVAGAGSPAVGHLSSLTGAEETKVFAASEVSARSKCIAIDLAEAYDFCLGNGFYVDATQKPPARR